MLINYEGVVTPSKTYAAESYSGIDVPNLKEGDTVVMLTDPPQMLTFMHSLGGAVHLFQGIESYGEHFGSIVMRYDKCSRTLIDFPDGLVLAMKASEYNYNVYTIRRDSVPYDSMPHMFFSEEDNLSKILKDIMDDPTHLVHESEDKLCKYMYTPLRKEGTFLLMAIENEVDSENATWEYSQKFYIINTLQGVYEINARFEVVYDFLVANNLLTEAQISHCQYLVESFKYISKRPHKIKSAKEKIVSLGIDFEGMESFFKPVYQNADLDLEAYVDDFIHDPHLAFYINGKQVEEDTLPRIEIRKAKAFLKFTQNSGCGIHPLDGRHYRYGELKEDVDKYMYTTFGSKHRGTYYVYIDNHFLPSDREDAIEDAEIIAKIDSIFKLGRILQD